MHGHAARAVDGVADNTLHSCMILDNFYVEKPIWMVDLGRKATINGVVIVTWQGKNQGQTSGQGQWLIYLVNSILLVIAID